VDPYRKPEDGENRKSKNEEGQASTTFQVKLVGSFGTRECVHRRQKVNKEKGERELASAHSADQYMTEGQTLTQTS